MQEIWFFLQLVIQGLAVGSVYALVALGFVLIYKASSVINFAQGEMVMLGAFIGLSEISLGAAGSLDISVWGRNLTDEEYITGVRNISRSAFGTPFVGINQPRSYGIELSYTY